MENQLRCVMFNREEFLIEHQLDADVLFLLEGLYQYGVRVLNLDGKTTKEDMEEKLLQAGYRTEETLLIAARCNTAKWKGDRACHDRICKSEEKWADLFCGRHCCGRL